MHRPKSHLEALKTICIPGGVRVAEVRHLEDHLLHVVRVGAHLELADLKEEERFILR